MPEFILNIAEFASKLWVACHSPVGTSIALALFALSESLGGIKSIEESSVYQLIMNGLRFIKEKVYPSK